MGFRNWLEGNEQMLPDAKKVMYIACVLNKFSQTTLINNVKKWMFENNAAYPKGWIGRAHHMTVKFAPKQSDIQAVAYMLGQEIELQVTNWAYDEYGIACVVTPKISLPMANSVPHITIAHSREVGAVYSNTLLVNHNKWIPVHESLMLLSELVCVLKDNTSTIPNVINPASSSF